MHFLHRICENREVLRHYADGITSIFHISGGRVSVAGKDCTEQCGNNDFDHANCTGPSFFINETRAEPQYLLVADRTHKSVNICKRGEAADCQFDEAQALNQP